MRQFADEMTFDTGLDYKYAFENVKSCEKELNGTGHL
jgi:hypothetical protein